MSQADALFRAMRVAAHDLAAERLRGSEELDITAVIDETLRRFRQVVDFSRHTESLRARLESFLQELARRPRA